MPRAKKKKNQNPDHQISLKACFNQTHIPKRIIFEQTSQTKWEKEESKKNLYSKKGLKWIHIREADVD